jgi:tRNA-guanine family transglycosylase
MERRFRFGKFELQKPTLFASYRLGDFPSAGLLSFPWDMTGTEALLINAYDFMRPKFKAAINNGWNPASCDYLSFPDKPILIDSGAYYFRKSAAISITPEDVLRLQIRSKADVGVVLDHPFTPEATDKAERINTTLANTKRMFKSLGKINSTMQLMPVVHGHEAKEILSCLRRLKRMEKDGHIGPLNRVGIGSLAPLAQRGNARAAIDVIRLVRSELPEAHIHCFSMGSALLMLLAIYCGADTVDSQSWIVSAAFKLAQLPGHYVVRMSKREYKNSKDFRQKLKEFEARLQQLANEEGFTVKNWKTGEELDLSAKSICSDYVRSLVDEKGNEHIHNRACHNLWSYNFEIRQYRRAVKEGRLEQFITSRLSNTRYAKSLTYIQQ